jgi:hypothetical protein
MRRLLAVVALATLAGCSDPLRDNTVTGTWRGSSTGSTFILVMQQSGTAVAGSGTITSTGAVTRNLSISANYQQPSFLGTLIPDGGQPITLTGTTEGNTLVGTLTGGGFAGEGIALARD